MKPTLLLDAVTADTPSSTYAPQRGDYEGVQSAQAPAQVHISGVASVTLYGRTSSSMPWHPIVTLTNADVDATTKTAAEMITLFPQMRFVPTITSGTVSAGLGV
ncbi:hypothetical protein [Pyruvatibacter sp.]